MIGKFRIVFFFVILIFLNAISINYVNAAISFSISNPTINSDDVIEVDATISGLISSSCSTNGCYLQAELQSAGGYFGYTYNNSGEYVDFFKTPNSTDEIKSKLFNILPTSGFWTGKLKAKNNSLNTNYYGPGEYLLSFRRFSGNSISPTSGDSNSLPVNLTISIPSPTNSDSNGTPTPTPEPTSYTLKTPPQAPVSTSTPVSPKASPSPFLASKINLSATKDSSDTASILGENTNDPQAYEDQVVADKEKKKIPFFPIILIVIGLGFISFAVFSMIRGSEKKDNSPL